jgi:hypothetical protein
MGKHRLTLRRARSARLEGWAKGTFCGPPFETRSCGPLLRVRLWRVNKP